MNPIWPFFFFLFLCPPLHAGHENTPMGARSTAMADASICLDDVWSSRNNQAGLAFLRIPEAAFFFQTPFLMKELKTAGLVLAIPVRNGTFGLDLSSFGYALYTENKYGLSFARTFGQNFSAGIQLDYLSTRIAENYGASSSVSAEAGIQARILKGLTLAAHLYNPTRTPLSSSAPERIPTTLRLGLSYIFSDKVLICAESEKDSWHAPLFKTGLEYKPRKELVLRAGLSTNPSIMAFGFGLLLHNFRIDLSSSWNPLLGTTPALSMTYNFSQKSELK
jgi:hypothetical protein